MKFTTICLLSLFSLATFPYDLSCQGQVNSKIDITDVFSDFTQVRLIDTFGKSIKEKFVTYKLISITIGDEESSGAPSIYETYGNKSAITSFENYIEDLSKNHEKSDKVPAIYLNYRNVILGHKLTLALFDHKPSKDVYRNGLDKLSAIARIPSIPATAAQFGTCYLKK